MDTVAFASCLDDAAHWAALQDSITQAYELELSYVPSVLVNDKLLDNAMDLPAAIDAALGE